MNLPACMLACVSPGRRSGMRRIEEWRSLQPAGQQAPGQQAGGPPQMTPEEREKRMKELQEQIAKAPDVDFFYRFGDYKPVNGLNLPHLITRATADQTTEEWVLKYKINPNIKADRFVKKQK